MLISIREFEKEVQTGDDYKKTCLAKKSTGEETSAVAVICDPESFLTALDFFADPEDLEKMTEEQITKVLKDVIDDPKKWKAYKSLFDNEVASDKQVKMMRSILSQAGPVQDGDKRYENI